LEEKQGLPFGGWGPSQQKEVKPENGKKKGRQNLKKGTENHRRKILQKKRADKGAELHKKDTPWKGERTGKRKVSWEGKKRKTHRPVWGLDKNNLLKERKRPGLEGQINTSL